jgi:hypothetical protein
MFLVQLFSGRKTLDAVSVECSMISDSVLDVGRWALDVPKPFPGGVAERLIAPVLKTGRPKGLVSSNLTPSAKTRF